MHRAVGVVMAAVGALALAGCTGGSAGADAAATTSAASGPASATGTTTGTRPTAVTPTGSTSQSGSASGAASTPGSPTGAATISPPPVPTVPADHPGAFALTSGGTPVIGYLTAVDCGQDGSMTSDQLTVSPGATSVTLTAQPVPLGPVTFPGSGELDAAGGTFRGADARGAITVVWTC